MQIIIENGSYGMQNLGDVAMLRSTVNRLRHHWPDASLEVVTERPDRLLSACPDVVPLPVNGCWSRTLHKVAPKVDRILPRS